MKVESPQQLEKLIKMLRKNGVEHAKIGEIELKLGHQDLPAPSRYMRKKAAAAGKPDDFPKENQQYTDEQILMWSSTPPGAEPPADS